MKAERKDWSVILDQAARIMNSYDTGVTLRQLFYRLVAAGILPNTKSYYTTLSDRTAAARRLGTFPSFIDRTRSIHRPRTFESPNDARQWLSRIYRRDRTEGQSIRLYLGVEKNGLVEQLSSWFWDTGIPIIALGGYSSQTYVDEITEDIESDGRPAVLIYAGDLDPSGEDIERDFVERCGAFVESQRIALTVEQVEQYDLPPAMGKATDTRAAGFVRKYGSLIQVELDALEPPTLRALYQAAIDDYFDKSAFDEATERERTERDSLVD